MSAPLACPRCGYQNQPGYQFCTNCGAPLAVPPGTAAAAGYPPAPAYAYPTPGFDYERTKQIDRTKTGVLLLLIGSLLYWLPFGISIIGLLLLFIGAVLVIFGRKAFGAAHSRNVVVSIVLFIIGIIVVIAVAVIVVLPTVPSIIAGGGVLSPPAEAAASNAGLVGSIAAAIVLGVAEVLFTYGLQAPTGRILLWAGYGANVVLSIAIYAILSSHFGAVVTQADYVAVLDQQGVYQLLAVVPAVLFAAADYLAWSRIARGEIPGRGEAFVSSPPWVPPGYPPQGSPQQPPLPPPSGPAPPTGPR